MIQLGTIAALLAGLALPTGLTAQTGTPLVPETRVRVILPSAKPTAFGIGRAQPLVGTVASMRGDTLVLRRDRTPTTAVVPLASVARIEVSRGVEPRGISLLKGAATGALDGMLVAPLAYLPRDCEGMACFAETAAISAGIGALAGGILGVASPRERWLPIALAVRVGLSPNGSAIASITF